MATGEGVGYAIISSVSRARQDAVWALVVSVTLASLLIHALVSVTEPMIMRRMGETT